MKLEKRYSAGLTCSIRSPGRRRSTTRRDIWKLTSGDNSRANIRDLRNEKGLSSYDQPLNDTFSVVYALPFGRRQDVGAAVGTGSPTAVLGGWQLTLINTVSQRPAHQHHLQPDRAVPGDLRGLPPYVPTRRAIWLRRKASATTKNYLNAAPVQIPTDPSQPFGTIGRNAARGYGLFQADLGLHKEFPLWSESSAWNFAAKPST